jgi:hypothetical protein
MCCIEIRNYWKYTKDYVQNKNIKEDKNVPKPENKANLIQIIDIKFRLLGKP